MDHEERRPLKILPMSVDDMARSSKEITLTEARVLQTRLTNLMRKGREEGFRRGFLGRLLDLRDLGRS